MAPISSVSPVTGNPLPPSYLHASDTYFRDIHGRAVLLRGVNLSGSSKAPVGQPSHQLANFWEDAEDGRLSFIGRPLDLEDGSADVHLARLRAWGFNCLRFVFTWEAIEHRGPGKYDDEYLEYVVQVLYKCKAWGFRVYMDPHQDVWSRFSGGSGAPLWTIYACGMDPRHISTTFAALLHCEYPSSADPQPHTFPGMIWGTNYTRLFSETLFTLFFAGKTYAPKCVIDGMNIQDYLQNHYVDAVGALAKKIAAAPGLLDDCVIGWDSMNEPSEGLVGHPDIANLRADLKLRKGPMTTPFEGMRLGMGQPVEVDNYTFGQMGPSKSGKVVLDPKGVKLWLKPEEEATRGGGKWGWTRGKEWPLGTCIWGLHGVWDPTTNSLRKRDYFSTLPSDPSRKADFVADFFTHHWMAYGTHIRMHHPEAIHFVQAPVFHPPPKIPNSFLKDRACSSAHFYDGLTLMTKHWNWFNADALGMIRGKYWNVVQSVRVGESAIRGCVQGELGILKADVKDVWGDYPTLIGEMGCPYDLDEKRAYGYVEGGRGEGDYSQQQRAWDCSLNAADGPNCLNYTMWTYCPDNSHQWGDLWNGEDLSIWSPDDAGRGTYSYLESGADASQSAAIDTSHEASFTSLASSATLTGSASQTKLLSPYAVASGQGVTPKLILDGARAIGAISRPYPVHTVGTPERFDFDIKSTSFRYVLHVDAADKTDDDEVCTEVYLPFVHYAASLTPISLDAASGSVANSRVSLVNLTGPTGGKTSDKEGSGSRSSSPLIPATSPLSLPGLVLDVEIRASHGRTEVQGQYLKWYYPVPVIGKEKYTLEVRRKGGALVRQEEISQEGSWGEVCPGCSVM